MKHVILLIFCILSASDIHRLKKSDDESLLWHDANAPLNLTPGQRHPILSEWYFVGSCEFSDSGKGVPRGWTLHDTQHIARMAKPDSSCFCITDGYLHLTSKELPDSIDNGYGRHVKYHTFSARSVPPDNNEAWSSFENNMRIEVRARYNSLIGFNNAIWFMGYEGPWPANGEIDMLESPKPDNTIHFTLHSANHYSGYGKHNSISATTQIADKRKWNIYWVEILPDTIRGGVNGECYFIHHRGDNGNNDWPWDNSKGMYMLITSGLSTQADSWAGKVEPEKWTTDNYPYMDIDWIRTFQRLNSDVSKH